MKINGIFVMVIGVLLAFFGVMISGLIGFALGLLVSLAGAIMTTIATGEEPERKKAIQDAKDLQDVMNWRARLRLPRDHSQYDERSIVHARLVQSAQNNQFQMIGLLLLAISLPFFVRGLDLIIIPYWDLISKSNRMIGSVFSYVIGTMFVVIALVTAGLGGFLIMKTSNFKVFLRHAINKRKNRIRAQIMHSPK